MKAIKKMIRLYRVSVSKLLFNTCGLKYLAVFISLIKQNCQEKNEIKNQLDLIHMDLICVASQP